MAEATALVARMARKERVVLNKKGSATCAGVREMAKAASTCATQAEACESINAITRTPRSHNAIRSLFYQHRICCGTQSLGSYLTMTPSRGPHPKDVRDRMAEAAKNSLSTPESGGSSHDTPTLDPAAETEPKTVRSVRGPTENASAPTPDVRVYAPDRTWIDWQPEPEAYDPPHIIGRFVVFPDTHVPYHSKGALKVAIRAAKHHIAGAAPGEATAVVIGGDFIDCHPASRHFKNPSRSNRIQDEIDAANDALDMMDEIGAASKFFQEGNHELRLPKYVADRAPILVGTAGMTVPEMLRLEERGWKWISYHDDVWLGQLMITHDVGRCGKYAIHQSMDDVQENVIINHIHRIGMTASPTAFGKLRVAGSFGCLIDFEQVDWQQRRKVRRSMAHGIGIGYIDSRHTPWIVPVPIVDERYCVIDGKVIF